jgi:hypothetical protein
VPGTNQSPITYRTVIEWSAGVGAFWLGCDQLSGMLYKENLGLIYGDYSFVSIVELPRCRYPNFRHCLLLPFRSLYRLELALS